MTRIQSPLSYVYSGRECRGFILKRGKLGFEALDFEQVSLGLFASSTAAADAVFRAAAKERGGD